MQVERNRTILLEGQNFLLTKDPKKDRLPGHVLLEGVWSKSGRRETISVPDNVGLYYAQAPRGRVWLWTLRPGDTFVYNGQLHEVEKKRGNQISALNLVTYDAATFDDELHMEMG